MRKKFLSTVCAKTISNEMKFEHRVVDWNISNALVNEDCNVDKSKALS